MDANRIVLGPTQGRFEEALASGIFSPGHLIALGSDGGFTAHAVKGGKTLLRVAVEDALQGAKTVSTAYAVGDRATSYIPRSGETLQMRLPIGRSVAIGDLLISNGDGALAPAPTGGNKLYESVADSAAITNLTAETDFDKSFALSANDLAVGDVLHIRALVSVPAQNSTDTLNVKLYIGTVAIAATGAVDVATGDEALIDAYVVVTAVGASGNVRGSGLTAEGVPGTVTGKAFILAPTALDTTVANTIKATATWSVANAGNQAVLKSLTVTSERGSNAALVQAAAAVDNSAGSAEAFVPVYAL